MCAPSHPLSSSVKQSLSVLDIRAPGICTRTSSPNIARQRPAPAAHEPLDIMRLNTMIPRDWYGFVSQMTRNAEWKRMLHLLWLISSCHRPGWKKGQWPDTFRRITPAHALQLSYSVARAETGSVFFTSLHLRYDTNRRTQKQTETERDVDSTATKWDGLYGHVKPLWFDPNGWRK